MKVTNKAVLSIAGAILSVSAQANIPAVSMVSSDVMIEQVTINLESGKSTAVKATTTEVSSLLERKLQAQLDASLEQRKQALEKR